MHVFNATFNSHMYATHAHISICMPACTHTHKQMGGYGGGGREDSVVVKKVLMMVLLLSDANCLQIALLSVLGNGSLLCRQIFLARLR